MKTGRRTLEELSVSRRSIVKRWSASAYGELPEEPITNYMDASYMNNTLTPSSLYFSIFMLKHFYFCKFCLAYEVGNNYLFSFVGSILRTY